MLIQIIPLLLYIYHQWSVCKYMQVYVARYQEKDAARPQAAHTLFLKFLNKIYFFCISTCLSSVDFGELSLTVHRTASSCQYAKELAFQNEK